MSAKLDGNARKTAISALSGWSDDSAANAISRTFKFKDFSEAFGFMARVALLAEAAGHHPDWSNSYNKVTITLSTHSAGGVTAKDIALATAIDRLTA